jgi:hypothetical protein
MTETPDLVPGDDEEETPAELPVPPVGEQEPDDPRTIPPDVGDAESGAKP